MAVFYGQVDGTAQTVASRRGSNNIKASVQSWNGSIITTLRYKEDELWITVDYDEGSSFYGKTIYDGSVQDFVEMCKEWKNRR